MDRPVVALLATIFITIPSISLASTPGTIQTDTEQAANSMITDVNGAVLFLLPAGAASLICMGAAHLIKRAIYG